MSFEDQPEFSYHPRCKSVKNTHLIFTDDLLQSVRQIKDQLKLQRGNLENFV